MENVIANDKAVPHERELVPVVDDNAGKELIEFPVVLNYVGRNGIGHGGHRVKAIHHRIFLAIYVGEIDEKASARRHGYRWLVRFFGFLITETLIFGAFFFFFTRDEAFFG